MIRAISCPTPVPCGRLGWAPKRGVTESVAAYAEWLKGMDGLDGILAAANARMRSLGVVRKAAE